MSDLISRKALLERLEKIYGTNSIVDKIMLRFLKKLIRKQPAADRWIPCSERLPEEDGNYLISGVWGSGKEAVGDCDFSVNDGYFRTAWNFNTLAWMPLPSPYKVGDIDE